jgi:hypothetical protein
VKATVDQLVHEECPVTIEAICLRSVEFDAQKKGVKKAGILGNEMAYAYYRQHSVSYQRAHKRKHPVVRKGSVVISSRPIDPERDIARVRSRYLRQNKGDLVERLLAVEQAYAECQQQLARLQFTLVDLQHEKR